MTIDIEHLKQWIGRTETRQDIAIATPVQALAATLDRDDGTPQFGDPVPPCWHWLYFLPLHRQSEIGPDGHPKRGGFLPPVPLPRRMWAGSRFEFLRPVTVGSAIKRDSRIVDDVLLFRYSALTFNGHRIHYDRRYVTEVEGYPGLIVHGPLTATLLLDLLRRNLPDASVATFSFRGVKPLFDVAPFQVCGRRLDDGKTVYLWAQHADGSLAMEATAALA
jgi:hydroxyacyl-ACP dehydratase HTD2-like protein with hotdog domain